MAALRTATIGPIDIWSYAILYVGVAASWVGIPIVGAAVLAAAGGLAGDGKLNVWVVIAVATAAAWTGGYLGYVLGVRAGAAVAESDGRWQRQRRQAMRVGARFYRRWGPLAVFLTPTWVSGALRMPRNSFLAWNAVAAIVSSLVTVFGAYAIASAILGQLSVRRGVIVLAALALALATVSLVALRRRRNGTPSAAPRPGCHCEDQ